MIQLPLLNGQNGFKLDGETDSDESGFSVSAAGDINSDGYDDVIIGAFGYPGGVPNFTGRSYVVFGGPEIGAGGLIPLSGLNGSNGFKLDGENHYDCSGISVSAAGDINGDGHDDLIIGASGRSHSYVVFGGSAVGASGILNLSSLSGTDGFKIDGENRGDFSGWSVNAAGDINNDGNDDLIIGAFGYPSRYDPQFGNRGRSYVVFGGSWVGSSGIFNLSNLNGVNGFKLDGENKGDYSGMAVNGIGDINDDGVWTI